MAKHAAALWNELTTASTIASVLKSTLYGVKPKKKTRIGLALAVILAMALGHVKVGRIEQICSLVQPIRQTG
ncbi:MAG: hypothetical protein PHD43_22030 [Methylococcales bacterium]|nr:hypothetical protein [Methylococcales bacterium]